MIDSAYGNAIRRREELKQELEELERFLALYRRFAGSTPELNSSTHQSPVSGSTLLESEDLGSKLGPAEFAVMAEKVILAAGRPLTRGELAEALMARGVKFSTEDVPRYLGTILWRNRERFPNVPGK